MRRRKGFTLVELVVVVLILGILAAVAAPKMFENSSQARDNGVAQSLATIRDAIELYSARTGTGYPMGATSAEVEAKLDEYLRGTMFPTPGVSGHNTNDIRIVTTGALAADDDTGFGWAYHTGTGEFIINSTSALQSDPAISYDDL